MVETFTIVAITVCGCVFPGTPIKPGASDADFQRDEAACQAQAMAAPQSDDAYTVTREVRECLEARGWHLPPGVVLPL